MRLRSQRTTQEAAARNYAESVAHDRTLRFALVEGILLVLAVGGGVILMLRYRAHAGRIVELALPENMFCPNSVSGRRFSEASTALLKSVFLRRKYYYVRPRGSARRA